VHWAGHEAEAIASMAFMLMLELVKRLTTMRYIVCIAFLIYVLELF
jgi:lactate dehydrogenase-like 2-hydroxyacid dehydrogenase